MTKVQLIGPSLSLDEYAAHWQRIADEAAFNGSFTRAYSDGRKYTQLEAAVLSRVEADFLLKLAEAAWAIGERLTVVGQQAPDALLDALNLPSEYRPWFRHRPAAVPFSRIVRMDMAQGEDGRWHILEYNAREPGGLPELDFTDRVCDLYRALGAPVTNPNTGLRPLVADMLRQALPYGRVGFCSVAGYGEDLENTLAAAQLWGGDAVFGGWPVVGPDGDVHVSGIRVEGLYLYLPSEGFLHHPDLLDRLARGDFPAVNPGSALLMQDKRSLALAHQLCEIGHVWSPVETEWIRRYIPYTSVVPFDGEWVAKPAWAREGAGVYFGTGAGLAEPEYVYQQRIRIAQEPLPIWTVAGPVEEQVTPVVGVYVIDGQAAGFLTRVGGPVTDKSAHVVPTLVWDE